MKSQLVERIVNAEMRMAHDSLFMEHDVSTGKGRIYSFLNPVSYLDALKHKELFCQMDGLFADGSQLVAAIKICYGVKVTRYSFDMTSLAQKLLNYAARYGKSIYIVASKQEQVEKAVEIIREKYKSINIIGYRNGYFANEEEKNKEAKHIVELNPDFVIVGMGAIMQESFLLKIKKAGYLGIGFTCGGFIHQTARGEADYYPGWINRMNLRFLYRMWKEPHTRKRYFIAGLFFPARFVWERFFG